MFSPLFLKKKIKTFNRHPQKNKELSDYQISTRHSKGLIKKHKATWGNQIRTDNTN